MTIQVILAILGTGLFLYGILGKKLEIKGVKIKDIDISVKEPLDLWQRIVVVILGFVLIVVSITPLLQPIIQPLASISTSTPTPTSTSTPTPTSSPTSIPTPTPTEIPIVAPTPTERPTPTPTSIVVLPSPTATSFFSTTRGSGGTETIALESQRTIKEIRIDLRRRGLEIEHAGFSLWEVEIYGPGTGNLAIGATATASSYQNSYGCDDCVPGEAIDGDMNSRWSTQLYEPPQWFNIALPTPQLVDRIVLRWENAYAKEYCVTVIE